MPKNPELFFKKNALTAAVLNMAVINSALMWDYSELWINTFTHVSKLTACVFMQQCGS